MKFLNISNVSLVTLILLVFTWNAGAGESEVTWTNTKKYTDIRSGNESKSRFEARVFKNFEKHFAQLSEKLPEGQTLKVNVTNVDLAGDVRFGTTERIRIIRDIYIPSMKFTYELVNEDKSIADKGDIDLKDMSFMFSSYSAYRSHELSYEKRMLDKWFNKTFIQKD